MSIIYAMKAQKERFQFPVNADRLPEGGEWMYEIKYDGYRASVSFCGKDVKIESRGGGDLGRRFAALKSGLEKCGISEKVVLDGEIAAFGNDGVTDFARLSDGSRLCFAAFDILEKNGVDLRRKPLKERREILSEVLKKAEPPLIESRGFEAENGMEVMSAAAEKGIEGIVAKRLDSPYESGHNENWVKVKCRKRREFSVVAYGEKQRETGIRNLYLAAFDGEKYVYVGKVGSGIDDRERARLARVFAGHICDKPACENLPSPKGEKVTFVCGNFAAEVEYAEITPSHRLRQPSYKGLRTDKAAKDVLLREAHAPFSASAADGKGGMQAVAAYVKKTLTNPDRIIEKDMGASKSDIANYYAAVSGKILPFLSRRALAVIRCRQVGGEIFFKKHPSAEKEEGITPKNKDEKYIAVSDVFSLVNQVQYGSVEFHIPCGRAENADVADMLAFDLDPDEGLPFGRAVEGALDLKETLDMLGLKSFVKTSGGKGYHILVPLSPAAPYDFASGFSRKVAQYLSEKYPKKYTSNIRKSERKGRLFIDFLRVGRGATFVAPYSLRARKALPVSAPVDWSDIANAAPDSVGMKQALAALGKRDPWAEFFSVKQGITPHGGTLE